jgi:hypothetical protein
MCFICLNACLIYRIKYENDVVPQSSVCPASGLDDGQGSITEWYQSITV